LQQGLAKRGVPLGARLYGVLKIFGQSHRVISCRFRRL
jgi:hypothetical protein